MTSPTEFSELEDEIAEWSRGNTVATLWWRDDDAVEPSTELERLLALAKGFGVPLGLAVIPALASEELAGRLAGEDAVSVLQHGYRHQNLAAPEAKKCEFPGTRPVDDMLRDVTEGWRRLECFTNRRPVFVPPWNRVSEALLTALPGTHVRAVSGFGPAGAGAAGGDGVPFANTHVDIIDWRGDRGFVGADRAVGAMVSHLRARRTGAADAGEATGLLTHHLDHDSASWRFLEALMGWTRDHPAVEWLSIDDILARVAG